MSWQLSHSPTFVRTAKRMLKKHPGIAADLQTTLQELQSDPFQPALRTHKLKGELKGMWACSLGYDLRIVFEFIDENNAQTILLHTVGTHDEVY